MDIQDQIQNRRDFEKLLEWTAIQVDNLVVGKQHIRNVFIMHIDKTMAEAEKYRTYLKGEYHKAKKAKRMLHSEKPKGNGWYWYTSYGKGTTYYFGGHGTERWVTFWMQGKPKLDPLDYFKSMVLGSVGQMCKTLDLIDYQFTFLSMIHDAQRWAAGHEKIYFNPNDDNTLSNKFSNYLCSILFDKKRTYLQTLQDVQVTILTALEKANSYKLSEVEPDTIHAKCLKIAKKIKSWIFKKTTHIIGAVIISIIGGFIVAILIDIFADFGWIERIKSFIYKILKLN